MILYFLLIAFLNNNIYLIYFLIIILFKFSVNNIYILKLTLHKKIHIKILEIDLTYLV